MKSKISYLIAITSLLISSSCIAQKKSNNRTDKPNLVIIHTDEHNFRTLSCYQNIMAEDQAFVWGKGNNVNTPNIDKIATEGAICTFATPRLSTQHSSSNLSRPTVRAPKSKS